MAYKVVAILVILVSCSTLLFASQDCGGYQHIVNKSEYKAHLGEIKKRITKPFCIDDITCFVFTSIGNNKNYCVQVKIPAGNGRFTVCTAKWESSGHGSSSTICSTSGNSVRFH